MAKKKYKNILLVGVDFTSFSEEAIVYASELAECLGSQLLVLHVIHDPAEAPGFYAQKGKKKKYLITMEDAANEMMEEFLKKMRKNYPNLKTLKNERHSKQEILMLLQKNNYQNKKVFDFEIKEFINITKLFYNLN